MLQRPAVCGAGEWMMGSSAREGGPSAVDMAGDVSQGERRLRQITDTIPAHIAYFDGDWVFRYGNRRYAEWFGTTSDAMTGRTVAEVIGPEVFAKVEASVGRALAGEEVTYEYSMTRSCGEVLYARSTLLPDFGVDGRVVGCYVHAVDITEQRRTYEALAQAQKMEAIGQLTGGLAHDFNNLLTVIIGNLAALRDQRPDDPALADFVDPALQSARRGAQLIKRLLSFSRQQPLEPQAIAIGQLIDDLGRLIRRSLPDTISINTRCDDPTLFARADPAQLESALLNFAVNARDAMPDGGRLDIAASHVELGEDAAAFDTPPGNYVCIEVSDTGCGMDENTLAHACEPFFTTKRLGLGSGLGLPMAFGFIRQSGGGMRIASTPGAGTRVSIVLPATPAGSPLVAADETELAASACGELVLLVEDDSNVRQVVRQQLIDLGHPVIEAEDADQALTMVAQIPDIAIVVSDVLMPGSRNGRQLAEAIRHEHPRMRIVLMSGYTDEDGAPQEPPILAKPFARQELAMALQRTRPKEKE